MLNTSPAFNLKAVLLETGLAADTLRAWERRYKVLAPSRTDGNYRLYSDRDIATLIWLKTQLDAGLSISRAVALLERLRADEAALFRFSALTNNAHRIHYDLGWCAVEGYDGLVVHGPLQALLLGEHARRHGDGLIGRRLDYRLVGPAVGTQVVTAVVGEDGELSVLDVHGRKTATATVHDA